jgi:hypothetical protein
MPMPRDDTRVPTAATPPAAPDHATARLSAEASAEAHGQQLLLYTPDGLLGGRFTCTRCRAVALQPDLLRHGGACPYQPGGAPITVW